jgi:hypothetical protein
MNENETLDFIIDAIEGLLKLGKWDNDEADINLETMTPIFEVIKAKTILQALKEFKSRK